LYWGNFHRNPIIYTPTYSKHVNVKHHKAIQIVVADASSNHKNASNHSRNHGKGINIKNALIIQWAVLNGILDNVISLDSSSKSGFLKLASFNGKGRSNNVIICFLQSETTWQKTIPLSNVKCLNHVLFQLNNLLRCQNECKENIEKFFFVFLRHQN
jgi:hypothetical protein